MADDFTFVTGATGFVGSHVVRLLRKRGDRVRILMRDTSRSHNIEGMGCEMVVGDLRDPNALVKCVQGCRVVYHVAADYRLWARDPKEIYESNVAGTRNLLSACCEAGVERVIYTSTVGAIGMRHDGTPTDESTQVALDDMIGNYKRSKFMAEQVAIEFAHEGLPVIIVNPTTPVGASDIKPTPTGKIILDFLRGRLPAYVDTGLNIVAVEDVAQGHILAEMKGKVGERYILGGENLSLRQILEILSRICGRRMPRFPLPWMAAYAAAQMNQFFVGTILNKEPSIPLEGVRMARHKMYVSSDKARRELGYSPMPAEDALRNAVEYFQHVWHPDARLDRKSTARVGNA
jgi:dihydroflavonol-4-reductase